MSGETIAQICVCDDEWCYCGATTEMPLDDAARHVEWTCDDCKAGRHVDIDGRRAA